MPPHGDPRVRGAAADGARSAGGEPVAIRFVDKTPATTETDMPADAAARAPQGPAVDQDAAQPDEHTPDEHAPDEHAQPAPPRPAPRRRRPDAVPAPTEPEGDDAPPPAEVPGEPEAASATLPGFEDRPKPKRRRGAARPYWGFG